jgi:sulfate adenylyltransferase subunit 1
VPISALKGWNVAEPQPDWCGYQGPHLLQLLESLPNTPSDAALPMAFPVQWVEKNHDSAETQMGRRVFWGRLAAGTLSVGQTVRVFPSGQTAIVARLMDAVRREVPAIDGHSAGVVLDREVDVSRGDWLLADGAAIDARREWTATVAWMDDTPLTAGRVYWALHGRRWVKARVVSIEHRLDIQTLQTQAAEALNPNEIGQVRLQFQQEVAALPYIQSRGLGAMVLVDTASHRTSAAALIQ